MPRLSGDDQPAVDAVEDDLDPARLACPPAGRGDVDQTAAGQKATDGIHLGGVARLARIRGLLHVQQHTPVACGMQVTTSARDLRADAGRRWPSRFC